MSHDKRPLAFLILIFLAIIWGSSFILMKRGLEQFTPPQVASIRLTVAFLCLLPFVMRDVKMIPKEKWKFIAVSGIFGNGIPAYLFTAAQTVVSSALAGILNSITPLFTMLIGYFFFQTKFSFLRITGVIIGLAGTVYLIAMNSGGKFSADVPHVLLIVLATLCYAASVNVIRHRLSEVASKHIAGFALFFAGPPAAVHLFTTDFVGRVSSGSPALLSFMYICLLAVFGTSISIVIFNYLIKISGALFAASCTYLIPVVAILWGYADNETLGISLFIGMAMILAGVYLIGRNLSLPKK
ncbi:MAG TPA: EamA family transporter [Bacteroidia bacterium]|nr:EamA family transporter [Bacteroidia bacterium]